MRILRRLLRYFKPYMKYFMFAVISLTVLTSLGLVRPKLIEILIDRVINNQELGLLTWIATGVILIALFRGIFRYLRGVLSEFVAINVIQDIRYDLYQHLMRLPYRFYDKNRTGEIMSRITGDVHALKHFLGGGILQLYDSILTFTIVFIILIFKSWQLTLLSMASLPFLFWIVMRFDSRIRPTYTEIREQMAVVTSTIQENVTGVRVVKASNNQEYEQAKFAEENKLNFEKNYQAAKIRAFYLPLMRSMGGLSALAVIWYGGLQVINGSLTIGELVAFHSYIWSLIWPIRRLGFLINFYERALASGARIFEVLDRKPEVRDASNPIELDEIVGKISFENVSFDHGEYDVLKDVDFVAPAGSTIAIIGETGSGKTSIVNLICRFYDVEQGSVRIDDIDVRELSLESLRRHIGIVQQDLFLFSATIKENIAFGNPAASQEEIVNAARIAQAHEFITNMEDGYDTAVGERGLGLSGGQKQRIAIARALVRNPKILILDDATSSVDMETEFKIQRELSKIMQGRTTFVIAHRLSTVKSADIILVLEQGRIIERGKHNELIKQNGVYRDIYDVQFKEQENLGFVVAGGDDN